MSKTRKVGFKRLMSGARKTQKGRWVKETQDHE